MMKRCQLPERSHEWTFDTFSPGEDKDLKKALDAALQLANEDGKVKWLTMLGDWDRGKTHLLVAICRQWLARGRPARYAYVPLLLKELRRSFDVEGEYDRLFDFFCKVPLLALDDLGVEKRTPWVMEELDTIVDYRCANALPLVVTSNLTMDELPIRIASRLQRESWCRVIEINAPEHRLPRM
uniref:Putative IstB domain protein ATP-binding protein n=2 Tax=viral metagenome TaxID=1070528 RepID=A0A6M3KJR6_9ZZZZ